MGTFFMMAISFLLIITIGLILLIKYMTNKTKTEVDDVFFAKHFKKIVFIIFCFAFLISVYFSYLISVTFLNYHYVDKNTAQKGFLFKDKIFLNEYKYFGQTDYFIFKMDNYTRSDRGVATETVGVIVNKNK